MHSPTNYIKLVASWSRTAGLNMIKAAAVRYRVGHLLGAHLDRGLRHYVVDQTFCPPDPFRSVPTLHSLSLGMNHSLSIEILSLRVRTVQKICRSSMRAKHFAEPHLSLAQTEPVNLMGIKT